MKRFLRNLPIKQKLMAITMAISGLALLLACAAFAVYEQAAFRRAMARDFAILADMFDDNVAAGLAFNDPASIEQTLKTLAAHQRIVAACVYDKQGAVIATYRRPGSVAGDGFKFPAAEPTGQHFLPNRLDTFKNIELAGEVIGVVYIGAELGELRERAWRYAGIVALLLAGCSLVALVLAARLQRIISQPIVDLAQTVATVAAGKNYAVRAHKESDDELGRLIDGFNEMLGQIQARDAALQKAYDELEMRVAERTQELARERGRFKFIFDSVPVGFTWMVQHQLDTRMVNPAQARITGVPAERCHELELYRLATHPDDRARQDVLHRQMMAGEINHYEIEKRYIHGDGSIHWAVLSVRLHHATTSDEVQEISTLVDITERKQVESRLEETHQQLLDTSRRAGMAEVATGVLHNVGNVLNSLNVSASVIATGVRLSKADSLAKLADLLHEHAANLGEFLTSDPKGKRLPELIASLARHLGEERSRLLAEITSLQNNIDHIKEIVTRQQAYATVVAIVEPLEGAALMDEALHMSSTSLSRHDVKLVREFQATPPVLVERGKVLQILINLIGNAKHACDAAHRNADHIKVITARVGPGAPGFVRLSVQDNGVGIPAANLTRIFQHGFTTKATGHGFGLHSSANAAREMKGSLAAHSDGPGTGATFILTLPVAHLRETATAEAITSGQTAPAA